MSNAITMPPDYIPTIPKAQLVHGAYYSGHCRNASVARWNAETQLFYHWRFKLGDWFVDTLKAPEDEQQFDVFVTESQLDQPEKEIPFRD